MSPERRPGLAPHVYLHADRVTGGAMLLLPEDVFLLNDEAAAIVSRCDGRTPVASIVAALAEEYDAPAEEIARGVADQLEELQCRRLVAYDAAPRAPHRSQARQNAAEVSDPGAHRPYVLLAELTYRCPLHCPYCSNPARYPEGELSLGEWRRVFEEAAALGVLHVALSGGEPLLRPDLPELVRAASDAGLYPNLITSGLGLDPERAGELRGAGLESVQLSFQADEAALADSIAGTKAHERKLRAAETIRAADLALSLNVVFHRANISRLDRMIALAETLRADRIELANVQFYGWGYLNRAALLPTREQVESAMNIAAAEKARLAGRMDIFYVLPDYYETRPKPCMQGWGRRYLTVNPAGEVLPCPTAGDIPGMRFDNVREHSLGWIWNRSESFNRFRGTEWMPLPCKECPQREIDFGGCRCQAALLAGDPGLTDPVCALSPNRAAVDRVLAEISANPADAWKKRLNPGHSVAG
jgi:pyrroloquinoline quinone biosynthesis protein E